MAPTPLTERTRDRLLALLADDRPDAGQICARLRDLGTLDEVPAFSGALSLLAPVDLPEADAERVFTALLEHRSELHRALRRDPGIRVAALDFLSNVERRLDNPEIVELSLLEPAGAPASAKSPTGLFQRRFFDSALAREVRRSRRYRDPFALILVDLDHFTRVNETFGHLFGDVVLESAARTVRGAIREADLGGHFTGTGFAVLLPETGRDGAAAVAERIRTRFELSGASSPIGGHDVPLTVSAGIACHPEDGQTSETLIARALAALRLAKQSGRNQVARHHAGERP